jgi:hypothetical protein
MSHPDLDPVDDRLKPVVQALGLVVLGAAGLEMILLADILRRRVEQDGFAEELSRELSTLETQTAGRLLARLKQYGLEPSLAARTAEVIQRRNTVVHHFMEDPEVIAVFIAGADAEPLVARLEQLAADCQAVGNEIGGPAFTGLQAAFGASLPDIAQLLRSTDLDEIADPRLRKQAQMIRELPEGILALGQPAEDESDR